MAAPCKTSGSSTVNRWPKAHPRSFTVCVDSLTLSLALAILKRLLPPPTRTLTRHFRQAGREWATNSSWICWRDQPAPKLSRPARNLSHSIQRLCDLWQGSDVVGSHWILMPYCRFVGTYNHQCSATKHWYIRWNTVDFSWLWSARLSIWQSALLVCGHKSIQRASVDIICKSFNFLR